METDGKTPEPILHQGADSIFKIARPKYPARNSRLVWKRVASDNRGDRPLGRGQTEIALIVIHWNAWITLDDYGITHRQ